MQTESLSQFFDTLCMSHSAKKSWVVVAMGKLHPTQQCTHINYDYNDYKQ